MPKPTKRPELDQARVKELFDYKEDGTLYWKIPLNKSTKIGDKAGTKNPNDKGYIRVKINGYEYAIHRLIYLWHTGESPTVVDHIDHNRQNNRIENLRAATHGHNSWNAVLRQDAKIKVKGVTYRPGKRKPWIAELRVNGKRVLHLSCYTLDEAERAVKEARRAYHKGYHYDG
jgi:hypothetical protein